MGRTCQEVSLGRFRPWRRLGMVKDKLYQRELVNREILPWLKTRWQKHTWKWAKYTGWTFAGASWDRRVFIKLCRNDRTLQQSLKKRSKCSPAWMTLLCSTSSSLVHSVNISEPCHHQADEECLSNGGPGALEKLTGSWTRVNVYKELSSPWLWAWYFNQNSRSQPETLNHVEPEVMTNIPSFCYMGSSWTLSTTRPQTMAVMHANRCHCLVQPGPHPSPDCHAHWKYGEPSKAGFIVPLAGMFATLDLVPAIEYCSLVWNDLCPVLALFRWCCGLAWLAGTHFGSCVYQQLQ